MGLLLSLVLFVFILISFIWYASFRQRNAFNYWRKRNIPHIEPKIPFGNLEGVGEKFHMSFAIKNIYDKFKETGIKYCGAYFYSRPIAIILDLNLAKDILIKDFDNFTDRGLYYNAKDDPLSATLATLDGHDWKKLRIKMTPAFSSGKIKLMVPSIIQVVERLRDTLTETISKSDKSVDIGDFIMRYTADLIGTCAFGIECNSLKNPNAEFIRMGRLGVEKDRHSPRFLALITSYKKIANIFRIKLFRNDVAAFFMRVIRETVEYRKNNQIERNDFMGLMLDMKKTANKDEIPTFNEIAAQINLFFIAGFNTSATTMTNCLYELAQNVDVQNKARQMIRIAFEKYNYQLSYEMIMELPYIYQILKETLRKYPLATTINRIAKNDYSVNGTDTIIEKSMWIKVPAFAIHRDAVYYPDPNKFDPRRFDSEEVKKRPSMAYLPFGHGPRECIGERFAMMQMHITLVILLHHFEFLACSDTVKSLDFNPKRPLMAPKDKILLKIHANQPIIA